MYSVIVNNKVVKKYPYKIQAIVYCFMKGYVYSGYDEWNSYKYLQVLDDRVRIEKTNERLDRK